MKKILSSLRRVALPFVPFVVVFLLYQTLYVLMETIRLFLGYPTISCLLQVLLGVVFLGAFGWWYIKKYGWGEFRWVEHFTLLFVMSLLIVFDLLFILGWLVEPLGAFENYFFVITRYQVHDVEYAEHYLKLVPALMLFILAPVIETICVIGLLQKPLCKKMNPLKALLITAVVFFLLHFEISKFPYHLAGGLLFSYLYYKTNKLIYPILAHSFLNIVGVFFAYTSQGATATSAITVLLVVASFIVALCYIIKYPRAELAYQERDVLQHGTS